MECLHPLRVVDRAAGYGGGLIVPCGQCVVCRRRRSLEWVQRLQDEYSFHECGSFITLTYDDAHLPKRGTLVKRDLQLFLKRLRKAYEPTKIRFFACGEYGDRFKRPHYHAILFSVPVSDRDKISAAWSLGLVHCGTVTASSVSYVAAYTIKKLGVDHYRRKGVIAPFLLMSRRPGIGALMVEKNRVLYEQGFCYRGTYKSPLPRYYLKKVFNTPALEAQRQKKVLDFRQKNLVKLDKQYGDVYTGLDAEHQAVKAKAAEILARMRLNGRMS